MADTKTKTTNAPAAAPFADAGQFALSALGGQIAPLTLVVRKTNWGVKGANDPYQPLFHNYWTRFSPSGNSHVVSQKDYVGLTGDLAVGLFVLGAGVDHTGDSAWDNKFHTDVSIFINNTPNDKYPQPVRAGAGDVDSTLTWALQLWIYDKEAVFPGWEEPRFGGQMPLPLGNWQTVETQTPIPGATGNVVVAGQTKQLLQATLTDENANASIGKLRMLTLMMGGLPADKVWGDMQSSISISFGVRHLRHESNV